MGRVFSGLTFFIGWILSPFTWWNDVFVNIPLSYLLANFIYYITHLSFQYLVIGSYCFTNALGLILMYAGSRRLIFSYEKKLKAAIILFIFVIVYTVIMAYLNRQGKLLPLNEFFKERLKVTEKEIAG